MDAKIIKNRKEWLDEINALAYGGDFVEANELIIWYINKGKYKLTKKDASEILASGGIDVRYWFVKPMVKIGGRFPDFVIRYATEVLKDKNSGLYGTWNCIPSTIEGFKFAIETDKKQKGGADNYYYFKYIKYKNKYARLKNQDS